MVEKTEQLATIQAPPLTRFLLLLLSVLAVISLLVVLFVSLRYALAVFVGGLIAILGHIYFARYAFRFRGAKYAPLIWKGFVKGQAGRFSIIVIGFSAVFQFWPNVEVTLLFISFTGFYFITLVLGARVLI